MTMQELAKLANVSVSTVSKAFCESYDINEETKQHIFNIAKQYGCYDKFYKGKYHKKIVAIIFPELTSNYYTAFVEKLQAIIEANNCIAVLSACHFDSDIQEELIEYYDAYLKVDGIIVIGLQKPLKRSISTPIVSLFSFVDNHVDSVGVNFDAVIAESVETLIKYGHKNIVFLGEHFTSRKAFAFKRIMETSGHFNPYTYESDFRFEQAGQDGVKHLLKNNVPFTAIICAYDNIAFGAMKELKKHGINVPNDVSIIGMDNISMSQYANTSLTSIDSNADELCTIAWDLLYKKMKKQRYYSNQQITINGKLILRESVAEAKQD